MCHLVQRCFTTKLLSHQSDDLLHSRIHIASDLRLAKRLNLASLGQFGIHRMEGVLYSAIAAAAPSFLGPTVAIRYDLFRDLSKASGVPVGNG